MKGGKYLLEFFYTGRNFRRKRSQGIHLSLLTHTHVLVFYVSSFLFHSPSLYAFSFNIAIVGSTRVKPRKYDQLSALQRPWQGKKLRRGVAVYMSALQVYVASRPLSVRSKEITKMKAIHK
jgi:hypothetical protein